MDMTFYMFYFDAKKKNGNNIKEVDSFEDDLLEVVKYIKKKNKKDRTKNYTKEKIALYLNDYSYYVKDRILIMEFKSAKYAKIRNVVNTLDWKENKEKKKSNIEGDEESTSIGIKFYSKNESYCMYESNNDGVGFTKIREYLNDFVDEYHNDIKKDNILYRIESNNMISQNFLAALSKASRIKAVRLIIDQKDLTVSEYKGIADRDDLNSDIEICLKPASRGRSIHHSTIKDFYKIYNDKKKEIRKIYVEAVEDDGNPLRFDTEKMKDKHIIDIKEKYNGEADIQSVHSSIAKVLEKYK